MALNSIELLLVTWLIFVEGSLCPMAKLNCAMPEKLVLLPLEHLNHAFWQKLARAVHKEGKGGTI